jgi:anthranilate synthase/aminodeoxychorismate synthase-like glutamine amidotransferase
LPVGQFGIYYCNFSEWNIMKKIKVLFIDNFDSFTYNLVDEFGKRDCPTRVYRADTPLAEIIKVADEFAPDLLLLSPGPGTPDKAGVTLAALDHFKDKLPIFGVCLGHQSIVQYFGGKVGHAPDVMHGKSSKITHTSKGVFEGLENPLHAGRYHSLCAVTLPDCLEETANYEGVVMGVQHQTLPIYGVQFHPESILTPTGGKVIENIIKLAARK